MSKFQEKIKKAVRFVLETVDIAVTRQETFDRLIASELMLKRYESFLSFVERIRDSHV